MKKHNFNAGPCEAIRDFDNTGIGLLEISHRTPGWERIMAETEQLWRDLLNIPDDYAVMFLGGGASTQFFEVPANLLKKKAAYLQTGVWAKKAAKEAKFYGEVEIVASSEDKTFSYIPDCSDLPIRIRTIPIFRKVTKSRPMRIISTLRPTTPSTVRRSTRISILLSRSLPICRRIS